MTAEQLTFGVGLGSQGLSLSIPTNSSVEAKDRPRLSRQAKTIYELLQQGPVATSELAAVACQYNARLSEIRHYLVCKDLMIDEIPGEGGENLYEIVPLERSTFWRRINDKMEAWKWL